MLNTRRLPFAFALASSLLLVQSQSWAAQLSAKDIAQGLFDRDDGHSQIAKQSLSTCKYSIVDKKRKCAEKPRVKVIESVRKDYGPRQKDKKAISVLLAPAVEKGIGFLQYDYEETGKEADQWMYLSALGKAKRIVSSNENEPKSGSFFGSEFSYEDMEQPQLDNYQYKLLKDEVVYQGRRCWVLEVKPTPQHAPKTNYSRSINWIDKERMLQLKSLSYDRQGRKIKRLTAHKVTLIDGIWIPLVLSIDNLQTSRVSNLKISQTAFNLEVDDDFLSLRTLTDAAFREQHLRAYRGKL